MTFSGNIAETGGNSPTYLDGTDVFVIADSTDADVRGVGSASVNLTDDILGQASAPTSDFGSTSQSDLPPLPFPSLRGSNDLITNNAPQGDGFQAFAGPNVSHVTAGVNPMLETLSGNSDPTETMASQIGSPVIAAGIAADYPGTMTLITTDQRGDTRRRRPIWARSSMGQSCRV